MKHIVLIVICLLITTESIAKVIAITHVINGGNIKEHIIIGTNKVGIKEYRSSELYKQALLVPKVLIRTKTMDHLVKYVKKNCNKVNSINERSRDFFTVTIILSNGQETTCFLENKNVSIPFFSGLQTWIAQSNYKYDCRKILKWIETNAR
jgi:hypothetical protein